MSDPSLLTALVISAKRRIGDFNAQSLANTAWAFSSAGRWHTLSLAVGSDAALLTVLATAAQWRVAEFSMQELVSTAWALATAGQAAGRSEGLDEAHRESTERNRPANATNTTSARAFPPNEKLFMALVRASEWCVGDFAAQGLANVA
eukprot:gnl/TRDRNA2_/TRDRNA2_175393_c6_seq1.p1 gnl/TRDRNA2_/TRDRNA2_175393_c6~~gnl/TRDRNA2_/TRDRNA2_175393_c6_seq1.p1  ORF type:complete len:148 (-),score=21.33 gnl/TRDRNA2_/TRDRNA2_175393_c6_seq1:118-561(-)